MTKIGLVAVFETSMISREGLAEEHDRASDRDDEDVDVLVGEDRVEDLAATRIRDRRAQSWDGRGGRRNQSVVQRLLRRLGQTAAETRSAMCAPVPPEIA